MPNRIGTNLKKMDETQDEDNGKNEEDEHKICSITARVS